MATCETNGHLYGHDGLCIMCKEPKPLAVDSTEAPDIVTRLRDEASLCRNETAYDVALLLDQAAGTIERDRLTITTAYRLNDELAAELGKVGLALTAEASRLDYIEDRLKATGEVYFVRAFDGDMQMNTADCVGAGSGSTLRDVIDAEMKESDRG